MEALQIFLRQVRKRSEEHRRVMKVLAKLHAPGQMVSVLRQELDSMIRVVYVLNQPIELRRNFIEASVNGRRWRRPDGKGAVTDKEMVELTQRLMGWTQSVYKFGCAFIHLSNLHDYSDRDPLLQISTEERMDILEHCRAYHGGPHGENIGFSDLVPYLPSVLAKVSANLECYLEDLELGVPPENVL